MNNKFTKLIEKRFDVKYEQANAFYVLHAKETHMMGVYVDKKSTEAHLRLYSEALYAFRGRPCLLTTDYQYEGSSEINDPRLQNNPKDPEELADRFARLVDMHSDTIQSMNSPQWVLEHISHLGEDLSRYPNDGFLSLRGFSQILLGDFDSAAESLWHWRKHMDKYRSDVVPGSPRYGFHLVEAVEQTRALLDTDPAQAKAFLEGRAQGVKCALGLDSDNN